MKLRLFFLALIFSIGAGVNALAQTNDGPVVVTAVAPVYPAIAVSAHATGDVIVNVKIDANGRVISADAVDGHALLKAASVSTARRWKFVPVNEASAERTAVLTFTFLEDNANLREEDRTAVFLPPYKVQVLPPRYVLQTNTVH